MSSHNLSLSPGPPVSAWTSPRKKLDYPALVNAPKLTFASDDYRKRMAEVPCAGGELIIRADNASLGYALSSEAFSRCRKVVIVADGYALDGLSLARGFENMANLTFAEALRGEDDDARINVHFSTIERVILTVLL